MADGSDSDEPAVSEHVLKALRDYDLAAIRRTMAVPHPRNAPETWAALKGAVEPLVAAGVHASYGPSFVEAVDRLLQYTPSEGEERPDAAEVAAKALEAKNFGNEDFKRLKRLSDEEAEMCMFTCTFAFAAGAALAREVGDRALEAICWTNLAFANASQGLWKPSLDVAIVAIAVNPKYLKAYFRAADAAFQLDDFDVAKTIFALGKARADGESAADYMALALKWAPPVKVVRVTANGVLQWGDLEARTLAAADEAFDLSTSQAEKCPVLWSIGLPVLVHRLKRGPYLEDCQLATFLMIDPKSGFAPSSWQRQVGDVLLFRHDRKDLTCYDVFGLWDWLNQVLDRFGADGKPPREGYRAHFIEWQFSYNASLQGSQEKERVHLLEPTAAEQADWDAAEV